MGEGSRKYYRDLSVNIEDKTLAIAWRKSYVYGLVQLG
jgi:hypothetical protein